LVSESEKTGLARICGCTDLAGNAAEQWSCPAADQSGEDVSIWLRDHGLPGKAVALLYRQQALCQYRLDEVKTRRGRYLYLVEHGAFDEYGFVVATPRNIYLRILKPSASVIAAAMKGVTLQYCKLANERALSARETELAARLLGEVATTKE